MRELKDELEVPGTAVLYQLWSPVDAIERIKAIIKQFEDKGYSNLKSVPECPEKEELRKLCPLLNIKPEF